MDTITRSLPPYFMIKKNFAFNLPFSSVVISVQGPSLLDFLTIVEFCG